MSASSQQKNLSNLVLITGASGGLGKAFAVECASRGWSLFLTDLNSSPLETLAASLRSAYQINVLTSSGDLTDPQYRVDLMDTIRSQRLLFGMLINVAGVDFEGPFFEQSALHIQTIIRLNVESTLEMTRGMIEFRNPQEPFRIINVASLAAFSPMPVKATYAASKRFLLDFSLALREELHDAGITVTVLCPAGMPTTAENIEAILAQGWMGQLTTQNVGNVANQTLNDAIAGRAVCVPGTINRVLQAISSLVPASLSAGLIGKRWKSAQSKRAAVFQTGTANGNLAAS